MWLMEIIARQKEESEYFQRRIAGAEAVIQLFNIQ
ncbi:hypothetical protein AT05_07715 [Schleiferia thermophila str. Yellowstone]|jgi:hypothetical protein|nr:hypothetical protein AT05_07715 [Schleiferia thermophila str. Yellowstone]